MWKIQPLTDKIKRKCLQYFVTEQNMFNDESMVNYYCKHSCKQFIRNKQVRFGYKIWCLCNSYLLTVSIYQGKSITDNKSIAKCLEGNCPFGSNDYCFPNNIKKLPFRFVFDNLFTGLNLLPFLRGTRNK